MKRTRRVQAAGAVATALSAFLHTALVRECFAFVLPSALSGQIDVRIVSTPPSAGNDRESDRRWRESSSSSSSSSPLSSSSSSSSSEEGVSTLFPPVPVLSHHACVKTRSMEMTLAFYSLLGYAPEAKFRAGPARAAWLTNSPPEDQGEGYDAAAAAARVPSRIEIIEVPAEVLDEAEGVTKRAADRFSNPALLGLDHVCLDVTGSVLTARRRSGGGDGAGESYGLSEWMDDLQAASDEKFGKTLRVALEPRVKRIGRHLVEMAYIYDADGSLLELINCDVYLTAGGDAKGGSEGEESSWDDEDDGRIVWKAG